MKRSLLRSWLGVSLLGLATVAGCRHSEKCCDCCCECDTVQSVVVLPETPARPAEMTAVVVTPPAKPVGPIPDDSQLTRTAAHKIEPAHEVLATVVAPDSASGGGIAGTMAVTASEAEAMGIRPGYTPGALYAPGSAPANSVLHLAGAHDLVPATEK